MEMTHFFLYYRRYRVNIPGSSTIRIIRPTLPARRVRISICCQDTVPITRQRNHIRFSLTNIDDQRLRCIIGFKWAAHKVFYSPTILCVYGREYIFRIFSSCHQSLMYVGINLSFIISELQTHRAPHSIWCIHGWVEDQVICIRVFDWEIISWVWGCD